MHTNLVGELGWHSRGEIQSISLTRQNGVIFANRLVA